MESESKFCQLLHNYVTRIKDFLVTIESDDGLLRQQSEAAEWV